MKAPLTWLNQYTTVDVSAEQYREAMMHRGFELASYEKQLSEIQNVLVGRIIKIEKHPDADKLLVCMVSTGAEVPLQIVTGASNVFEGALVPVAVHGAVLAGGVSIKRGKLRGVVSEGMLCSGEELKIKNSDYPGAEVNGILILKDDCKPGMTIQQAIKMNDMVFEFDILPNRPDCQSILGIARETAAVLGKAFEMPDTKVIAGSGSINDYARVDVLDGELCPRYTCRVVKDIRITPSPDWMQQQLKACGVRPINNIVDITNYVMLEYGQPMHAFDLSCVKDGHIIVRRANEGEQTVTLDGKTRILTKDMLVIADPTRAVGIAGVMGGENSEIIETTRTVLFESALFKGSNIRATANKLGLSTEAASRFSKGIDVHTPILALERAVQLVHDLGAGTVVGGVIDCCHADLSLKTLKIRPERVNTLLDLQLPIENMSGILKGLYMDCKVEEGLLKVTVPHFRTDIEGEADIAEEVARVVGYDTIGLTLMQGGLVRGGLSEKQKDYDEIKDTMVSFGAMEAFTYSFTGPAALEKLRIPENERKLAVKLRNPFGEDQSLMRTRILPGLIQAAAINISRKVSSCRLFELGNVHYDIQGADLPEERSKLGVIAYGQKENFYTLKGMLESICKYFGVENTEFAVGMGECFHPTRRAVFTVKSIQAGEMGQLHPDVCEAFGIPVSVKVFYLELDVEAFLAGKCIERVYKALPKYPAMERDIALVVDHNMLSGDIVKTIVKAAGALLKSALLFDTYTGDKLPEGSKSLAYKLLFRSAERTLTDDEVNASIGKILKALETEHNAVLRA